MYGLTKKEKLDFILKQIEKLELTSYDIGKKTNLSISGIEKIINGTSKNPHEETLNKIINFLENKVVGTNIVNTVQETKEVYNKEIMDKVKNDPFYILLSEKSELTKEVIYLQGILRKNNIPFKDFFEREEK